MDLVMQEVSPERRVEVLEPVREITRLSQHTPMLRALRLEKALTTETGAGQRGTVLARAASRRRPEESCPSKGEGHTVSGVEASPPPSPPVVGPGSRRGEAGEDAHLPDTSEERGQERLLRALLVTFVALTLLIACVGVTVGAYYRAAISAGGAAVYGLLLAALPHLGVRRTGYLCTAWYFLLATGAMASGHSVHDITMVLFPAGMLVGALLLDRGHLVPLVGLSIAAVVGVGALKMARTGRSEPPPPADAADLVVVALLLLVSGVLARLVVRSLQARVAERRKAEGEALASKRELEARNEALQVVNGLSDRLQRNLDVEAIAAATVDVLTRHSQPPLVAFYVLEGDEGPLRLVSSRGFTDGELSLGAVLPLEGSASGIAIKERRVVSIGDLRHDERERFPMVAALSERGIGSGLCIPLVHGDTALGTVNLVFEDGRAISPLDVDTFQGIARSVSLAVANARHVAGLEHQAFHDALTGLQNRAGLHSRFGRFTEGGDAGGRAGLVLLDIDRFREINDALGHLVGDELLVRIASRLSERSDGPRTEVFRLGGDEFAVLLAGPENVAVVEAEARRLLTALAEPLKVAGTGLEIRASAGVALYPDHGRDSHELLRSADVALYRAKQVTGGVAAYARELDEHTPERLAIISELGKAIRDGELVLHFQPKVALQYGFIEGFEALVRWRHPRLGLLGPAQFIPFAEATDVMHPLTAWVVENALVQLTRWNRQLPRLTMAVNLSARNLLDRSFPESLGETMRRVGVDPGVVEFELTETGIMADPEAALTALGRIAASGARLAIDDFGTGYSSLAYLKRLPVHVLKIDRSFVSDIGAAGRSLAIVRSTVQLAHSLELGVVAEGIEQRQSARALREMGCDLGQGFYFAQPAPAEDAGRCLEKDGWVTAPT